MNDFLAKRLADAEKLKQQRADERKKQWIEIQTRAPLMAAHLKALADTFGKLQLLSVEFTDDNNS